MQADLPADYLGGLAPGVAAAHDPYVACRDGVSVKIPGAWSHQAPRHTDAEVPWERSGRTIMKSTTLAMSVVALAGMAGGAVLVRTVSVGESSNAGYSSSTVSRPAAQASGDYVFACVNSSGKIDYLEFRLPLPHQCWFSGETLWHLAAVPAVDPVPSASPPASASPSPSPWPLFLPRPRLLRLLFPPRPRLRLLRRRRLRRPARRVISAVRPC